MQWPTVRDKGFYLKVSKEILILGLLQMFNPNLSTPAELIETFLIFFLQRQQPVYDYKSLYTYFHILYVLFYKYISKVQHGRWHVKNTVSKTQPSISALLFKWF